jgi:hypothetical protein
MGGAGRARPSWIVAFGRPSISEVDKKTLVGGFAEYRAAVVPGGGLARHRGLAEDDLRLRPGGGAFPPLADIAVPLIAVAGRPGTGWWPVRARQALAAAHLPVGRGPPGFRARGTSPMTPPSPPPPPPPPPPTPPPTSRANRSAYLRSPDRGLGLDRGRPPRHSGHSGQSGGDRLSRYPETALVGRGQGELTGDGRPDFQVGQRECRNSARLWNYWTSAGRTTSRPTGRGRRRDASGEFPLDHIRPRRSPTGRSRKRGRAVPRRRHRGSGRSSTIGTGPARRPRQHPRGRAGDSRPPPPVVRSYGRHTTRSFRQRKRSRGAAGPVTVRGPDGTTSRATSTARRGYIAYRPPQPAPLDFREPVDGHAARHRGISCLDFRGGALGGFSGNSWTAFALRQLPDDRARVQRHQTTETAEGRRPSSASGTSSVRRRSFYPHAGRDPVQFLRRARAAP